MKKLTVLTFAAALTALGAASLASAPASAKGFHGGGFHGGFHHHHHHWGSYWGYGVYGYPAYYGYGDCFWKQKPWGLVKVCY